MTSPVKHRLVRAVEKYLVNPVFKAALVIGVPMPLVLLETTGRRSGTPRRTVVANGLVGDTFWIVAEHGHRASYVRNLVADPRVRVRIGRRWFEGRAQVLVDDDPYARAEWVADQTWRSPWVERGIAKLVGVDPATVRIDLGGISDSPSGPAGRDARLRRDRQLGAVLLAVSGVLMVWAGYLFATAGVNAALFESIVPGITIEVAYTAYRRVDRIRGGSRPNGWDRLAQEAAGLGAGMAMVVAGYAAARWSWPIAIAAAVGGLPWIWVAIVAGRSRRAGAAAPELVP